MDLPIVIRSSANRLRWLVTGVIGGLVTAGMCFAAPSVQIVVNIWWPNAQWTTKIYYILMALPAMAAIFGPLAVLINVDRTWVIDHEAITIHSAYLIGKRTRTFPLDRITNVRVRKISGETDSYRVEIQIDSNRWIGIRTYLIESSAESFRRVIGSVIGRAT